MKLFFLLFIIALLPIVGISNPMVPSKSVYAKDFGVVADGKVFDSDALQKAIDSLTVSGGGGGNVYLPAGVMLLDKTVQVYENVMLIGDGASWENTASTFHVKHKNGPAFQIFSYCGIKGVAIYYPDNLTDEKMITPDEYPPSIEMWGCNVTLDYINFDGAWIAVSSAPGGANAGQCLFKNINGFAHYRGFYQSGAMDVNRYENIHWFPSRINRMYEGTFFQKNLIAFEFGRQDGFMMDRCFIIGGKGFFKQSLHTAKGEPEWSHSLGYSFNNCWIEDVDIGFDFEGVCGFTIIGSNILIRENGIGVRVANECIAYNAVISGVQIRGFTEDKPFIGIDYNMTYKYWQPNALNKLSITDCQIQNGKPTIRLTDTAMRTFIKGNLLRGATGYSAIEIAPKADYFTITDNIIQTDENNTTIEPIDNKAGAGKTKILRDNIIEDLSIN